MKFPVKVEWPREKGQPKVLTAANQGELDRLLRIGWKVAGE